MLSLVDIREVCKDRNKWEKCGEYKIRIENGYKILRHKKSVKNSNLIDGDILEIPKFKDDI